MKSKKILVIVRDDASSTKTWSGIPFHIIRILKDYGHDVVVLDKIGFPRSIAWKTRRILGLLSKSFAPKYYSNISAKYYGKLLSEKIKQYENKIDFIFAVDFTEALAFVETKIPLFVYRDASYALLNKINYPGFEFPNLDIEKELIPFEKSCLERIDKVFLTSNWAIEETKKFYPELSSDKYVVQPFSSQLYPPPISTDWKVREIASGGVIKFLFVGRDWVRKGGDRAIEILNKVKSLGLTPEMIIVGCKPDFTKADFEVSCIENLDVSLEKDYKVLRELYLTSHFFILPTVIEAFGIVFSEAMSLGLPVITNDVCAISEILESGVQGLLISDGNNATAVAQQIVELKNSPESYIAMQNQAFERFSSHFHPKVWVERLIKESETSL